MKNSALRGHMLAVFTILVWGSTFSATKALLDAFSSYEILVFRFLLAYVCLLVFYPKFLKPQSLKEEILFALCGLFGVCLYFLLENIALNYTLASNAGVLVSISPIYTAILSFFILKKPLGKYFIIGFIFALLGIIIIIFHGNRSFQIDPLGDLLCILAGLSWAFYTIFLNKLFEIKKNANTLAITKKIFFYGIIFSSLTLFYDGIHLSMQRFLIPQNLFNLFFLGIFASALCYLTWGMSLKILGTLKTSAYLYTIPIVSILVASFTLKEPITSYILIGSVLVLLGLFLSQKQT
ncbi:hypothetical protein BKH41_06335 [Helicobacter sp. 12S02232-10]|uniref:DMT family transporter n=1 Tax=Helicobacter sp. 12S02232-10 TaxID=1476197 RepID=UPI000BA6B125|nr:DMT family transporter [Helicobacter sp. 12S02232-10]PAF47885.1 hypothetical protein BKH41_06335 [Helicobacter sp. 12S02232-10]